MGEEEYEEIELSLPRFVGDGKADAAEILALPQPPFPSPLPPQPASGLAAAPASTRADGGWGLKGVDMEVAQTSLVDGAGTTRSLEPTAEKSNSGVACA
jgi:hypothetical protein